MSQENLSYTEAIEKLQHLVNKIDVCMFCSAIRDGSLHAVPMSRQEIDDSGAIWFLLSAESDTCKNVQKDPRVQLLYAQVSDYNFMAVTGRAVISRDPERIEKYWNKFTEAWFEKGKEDPNIRIMKVTVEDAHYWDNKANKLVTFLKLAASAVTGSKLDMGREGDINIPGNS
ncbi:MAG: pyridoxamine 5'-phosphate oxidase family protein [Niabella sp.]|nr:pyridoxamine 5'-phosphate oxidase family protein [Niabella sp.]